MFERIYSLKIFEGIEQSIIHDLINSCQERQYKSGEIIIKEKNPSNGEGYIIKSGNVEVIIGTQKIAELGLGDIFGEMALLNEEDRVATVRASSDLIVYVLNLEHLIEMINSGGSDYINKTIIKRIEENLER